MSRRLEFAVRIAEEAGRKAMTFFGEKLEAEYKADESPVTHVDREIEAFLRAEIGRSFPNESILGEEEGASGDQSSRWVIDPIDGTKSFVCGVPLWAILISYEEDGQPIVGVCNLPAVSEILYAETNRGAIWNGKRCRVSDKKDLAHSVICCGGHRNLARLGYMKGVIGLSEQCMATRTWCDAYGHALVATGRVEAMIDPVLEPYDISAMSLIIQEAGGRCTDFQDQPWPRTSGISTNGYLHEKILGAFE